MQTDSLEEERKILLKIQGLIFQKTTLLVNMILQKMQQKWSNFITLFFPHKKHKTNCIFVEKMDRKEITIKARAWKPNLQSPDFSSSPLQTSVTLHQRKGCTGKKNLASK